MVMPMLEFRLKKKMGILTIVQKIRNSYFCANQLRLSGAKLTTLAKLAHTVWVEVSWSVTHADNHSSATAVSFFFFQSTTYTAAIDFDKQNW